MIDRSYVFLTGVTGHIGNYLLKDLLINRQPLAVLVRDKGTFSAVQRVTDMVKHWNTMLGLDLPMPVCLCGDTSHPGFGLSQHDRQWVKDHCATLVHNAASVAFSSRQTGTILDNNLSSAKNTLALCHDANIDHLVFVSTAYVSGNRKGTVYEDELDCGQSFRNEYEHSKFEAERTIRQSKIPDCVTVIRPGIVVGDSESGYTSAYHSFYRFAQFTWVLANAANKDENGRWQHNVRLAMSGAERRNMVSVDWLSKAMVAIIQDDSCWGKTFHLTPTTPATSRDIEESLQRYFLYDGVRFTGRDSFVTSESVGEELRFYEYLEDYREYFDEEPIFDRSNTNHVAQQFTEPQVDVDCMLRLIDYAVNCRFGKSRRPVATSV